MELYVGLKFKTKREPNIFGEIVSIEEGKITYRWNSIDFPNNDNPANLCTLKEHQVRSNFGYFGWYLMSRLEESLL